MDVDTLVFDFAGTLTLRRSTTGDHVYRNPTGAHLHQVLAEYGCALPQQAACDLDDAFLRYRRFGDTTVMALLLEQTLHRHGIIPPICPSALAHMVIERAGDHPVDPAAAATLQRLHSRGYRILIAANSTRTRRQRQRTLDQAGLSFITPVLSSNVGTAKPDDAFYQHLLNTAGTRPQRMLFAGNQLIEDVLAPLSHGMHACLVDTHPERGQAERARRFDTVVINHVRELQEILPTRAVPHRRQARGGPTTQKRVRWRLTTAFRRVPPPSSKGVIC
ncbi:HAD family hydrolase [Allosalinactinospora lopnorensis]|uniref:HAD family hydrolase n=1 Tax=Allosalinactinospora lopnorensis TaxID=1352348 RepID=UPI0006991CC2|nr:HAD family hydrolase [Allosalinactinospora lopnorensis]